MNLSRAESHLSTFHDANPGVTSRAFEALPVRRDGFEFASTYRSLISAPPDTEAPLTVLDLACGDGHLLSLLADGSTSPARALIGIDLSAGELGAARSRSVDGIREMLAPGFDRIEFAELNTSRRCTPAQLWDCYLDMHDADLLTAEGREDLRQRCLHALRALQALCGPLDDLQFEDRYPQFSARVAR